jgi:hypothetical protein
MAGSKIATVRAEVTAVISALPPHFRFDVSVFGDQFGAPNYTTRLWGTLTHATQANKGAAIAWVNGPTLNPGGGTPTYAAIKSSCAQYPVGLRTMALLTDGMPNTGGGTSQVLADFPSWWFKFDDCELIAVCVGGAGASFMQVLASLSGGTYIAI